MHCGQYQFGRTTAKTHQRWPDRALASAKLPPLVSTNKKMAGYAQSTHPAKKLLTTYTRRQLNQPRIQFADGIHHHCRRCTLPHLRRAQFAVLRFQHRHFNPRIHHFLRTALALIRNTTSHTRQPTAQHANQKNTPHKKKMSIFPTSNEIEKMDITKKNARFNTLLNQNC
jgi:hypothetical protein